MAAPTNETQQTPQGPVFTVNNIYVKDISYESPQVPEVFRAEWKPNLNFDIQMNFRLIEDNFYEAVLHITLSVKLGEGKTEKTAFLAEIQQGGIFTIQGFEGERLEHILATTCPGILFPYAREVISSSVLKGGFPQLLLPPINFEAMYQRKLAEQQGKGSEPTPLKRAAK